MAFVLPPIAAVFCRIPVASEHQLAHTATAAATTIMRVVIGRSCNLIRNPTSASISTV
jgi:hypothetical protein